MAKLTLTNVSAAQGLESFATAINNNSQLIEEAFENTFSRDGTSPNTINTALDVNGQRVYNLPAPASNSDAARKVDVDNAISQVASDAAEAAADADAAAASAAAAAVSAQEAQDSAASIVDSVAASEASAAAAAISADVAALSEAAAELAEVNAEAAQVAAEAAQSAAATSASNAATSASTATTQAGIATTQAGLADTARIAAQLAETNAETAETNAETAEANAEAAAILASEWADKATAVTTGPDRFSAKYWADVASGAAIPADTIDNTKLANMATQTFKGRTTAGTGDPEDLSVAQAQALIIPNDSITNARLNNMAVNTIKGRITSGTGDPEDLTAANVRTIIGEPWTTLYNGVHSGAAISNIDINITGYTYLEIEWFLFAATVGGAVPGWRVSFDNASSYAAGATDYVYQYDTGYGTTAAAATGSLSYAYWGPQSSGGNIPAIIRATFSNGYTANSPNRIPFSQHVGTAYNGTNYQVMPGLTAYQTAASIATHIRIGTFNAGSLIAGINAGSKLIVKGC